MNEQSIFEYVVDHAINGKLEEGFTLANYDESLKAKGFRDGQEDMVARYNVDQIDKRNVDGIVNEIEDAVILISNGTFDEADRWFNDLGQKYRIINIAHLIFEYIGENSEDLYLDNIFQGAMYLLTESKNIESIKAAMVMLAMFQYDHNIKNIIRLFAQADEFTYFAVRAMDEWENGNLEIFQAAQQLKGWGKIYAIEMLEPSNIYIRDWILKEAVHVNVPKELIQKDYFQLIRQIEQTSVTNQYIYCQVKPYGMEETYSYIFPGQLIGIGDNVVIPFGDDDELIVGKVISHKICTAMDAPTPVSKTKTIIRVMTNDEIREDFPEIAEMEGLESADHAKSKEHEHCGCGCGCEDHAHQHDQDHQHDHQHDHVQDHDHHPTEKAKVTSINGDDHVDLSTAGNAEGCCATAPEKTIDLADQAAEAEKIQGELCCDDDTEAEVNTEDTTIDEMENSDEYIKTPPDFFADSDEDDDVEDADDAEMEELIQSEINELVEYIQEDDLDSILEWAICHQDENSNSRINDAVVDAYTYCVENDFEIDVAALNLGSIYYSGVTVPRDYVKAAKYYQMAANEGSVEAICNLGYCYYYGRHQAVDYVKAYGCFNMAGVMGSANALYKLGDMYLNGRYVDRNPVIAFKIYERAEETVSEWEDIVADIDLRLGRCYLRGIGVEQDLEYAMEKLCSAYAGLYARRKTDPFVRGTLKTCRDLMDECEEAMEEDFVERI